MLLRYDSTADTQFVQRTSRHDKGPVALHLITVGQRLDLRGVGVELRGQTLMSIHLG